MSDAEVWDVTDELGSPVGLTHVRGAADWPQGRFHVVAATCVVDEAGRVLITKRGPTKDFAGMWEFPGGSAIAGESSVEAAVRELREETGLVVPVNAVRRVERYREDTALFDLYLVAVPDEQEPRPDGIEVCDFEWVQVAEVDSRRSRSELADPWEGRLRVLWGPLAAALDAVGRT